MIGFLKQTNALIKSFVNRVAIDGGVTEGVKCIGNLDADFLMYPSGYKAGKLYSQKPVPVYGSELAINGDFDSETVWTFSGIDFSVGAVLFDNANDNIFQSFADTVDTLYQLTITKTGSGTLRVRTGFAGTDATKIDIPESGILYFTSTADTNRIQIYGDIGDVSMTLNNISVKEVLTADGDFTVVRNSTKWVNQNGVLVEIPINTPSFEFGVGECPVLLLEPQATNLITYSEDFSQWVNISSTDTANFSIAPNGSNTATRFLTTSQDSSYLYISGLAISDATVYTKSIYIKSNGNGLDDFRLYTTTGGTSANLTATTEWQRFDFTFTSTGTSTNLGVRGVVGQETDVLVSHAQLETGSTATSYMLAEGSTFTRLADVITGGGSVDDINSEEGVLFVDMASLTNTVTSNYISLSDGTYNNRISILFSTGTNIIRAFLRVGGVSQADSSTSSYDITNFNKIAFKYKENDFALWINGVEIFTDTSGSTIGSGVLNEFAFSEIGTSGGALKAKVRQAKVYKRALTDIQLTELTTDGFVTTPDALPYNTVIGDQGSITTTAGALETLLGLTGGDVSYFNLNGNDIQAKIDVDYTLTNSLFKNNTTITSYRDTDEHAVEVEAECFRNATNANDFLLLGALIVGAHAFRNTAITSSTLNATSIGSNVVRDCALLVIFDARYANPLGNTFLDNNVFLGCTLLTTVNCSTALLTNNAGGRDGDIAYAEDVLLADINPF